MSTRDTSPTQHRQRPARINPTSTNPARLHPARLRRTSIIALLATVSLCQPHLAFAGPDDGKPVATQGHVDSPKTWWTDNGFELYSEFDGKAIPANEAVAWIGKGWSKTGEQQYQFIVPDNESFDYIGKQGETYYMAPDLPIGNQDPIWLGFGASANLPDDTFRGEIASLDLLSVTGPGDVEMFAYHDSPSGFHPLLGTSDSSPHATKLTAGTHTHNYTLFTKPGRYELTFRTTARTNDGELIASAPTTTAIQVGGNRPLDTPTPSLSTRFDAAPRRDLGPDDYQLSLAPKATADRDGDDKLTAIDFTARDSTVSGTLTLLIDGHFLTDLPVTQGQAQWEELLGAQNSSIQGVFTPDSSSQNAGRWISQPLDYSPGRNATTSSEFSAQKWNDNSAQVRELFSPQDISLGARGVSAHIERINADHGRIVVETEDPNFHGFLTGGFYDSPESKYSLIKFSAEVHGGRGEYLFKDANGFFDGDTVKIQLTPHPLMNEGSLEAVLTDNYSATEPISYSGTFDGTPRTPGATSTPTKPGAPETCEAKPILDAGHVDIKATGTASELGIALKDETGALEQGTVERALDDVILAVHDNALTTRPDAVAGKDFDFLGPKPGSAERFYLLPQAQNPDIIWPGYNTQDLDYKQFDGPVTLHFDPVNIPDGASWGMFISEGIGGANQRVLLDSLAKKHSINTTFAAHTHANWAFSQPGIYQFDLSYSGTTTDGKKVSSTPQRLTLALGDATLDSCLNPSPEPTDPTSADPTPAEPTPSEPTPANPTPADPTPSEPAPADPTPNEPGPDKPDSSSSTTDKVTVGLMGAITAVGVLAAIIAAGNQHAPQLMDWWRKLLRR